MSDTIHDLFGHCHVCGEEQGWLPHSGCIQSEYDDPPVPEEETRDDVE